MCAKEKDPPNTGVPIIKKPKKTFCEKYGPKACLKRCCRFACRRLKRCIKKKIFGTAKPRFSELEIAGLNLGDAKGKIIPKRESQIKPPSKFKIDSKTNNQGIPKTYIKDLELLEGLNASKLKKKYALTPSKSKILDDILLDYTKGALSVSKLPADPKLKKKKKLNKAIMNNILNEYDVTKKKRQSNTSKFMNKLKEMDTAELKKKFSMTSSKHKVFQHMIDDYKNKKISFSKVSNRSKLDIKTLSKGKVQRFIREYDEKKKDYELPFHIQSKLDLIKSYIEELKKRSISSLKKKFYQ